LGLVKQTKTALDRKTHTDMGRQTKRSWTNRHRRAWTFRHRRARLNTDERDGLIRTDKQTQFDLEKDTDALGQTGTHTRGPGQSKTG
jgi:hypothetical protein